MKKLISFLLILFCLVCDAQNGNSTITASYAVLTGATAKYSYNGTSQATPSGTPATPPYIIK